MIKINQGKGFHLTFNNGLTISVQIGPGNYCDNYNDDFMETSLKPASQLFITSSNAEVAVWDSNGNWLTKTFLNTDDDVKGYLSVNEVVDLINKVKNYQK